MNYKTQTIDANGSLRVTTEDDRLLGVIRYQKGKGSKLPGWASEGCVMGPLAVRHDTPEAAVEALVNFQLVTR